MRSFGFNRRSAAGTFRRTPTDKLREFLFKVGRFKTDEVYRVTQNRQSRRMLARMQRNHGRGFTKPRYGPAHTRGSGYHQTTRRG